MTLLKVNQLTKTFGGLTAVSDVNLEIESNELIGLIGPNGAGKTTLFNLITGVYEPTSGNIELAGQDISGAKPEKINQAGIGRTFQNIRLFANLTVLENVLIALHTEHGAGFLTSVLRLPAYYRNRNQLYRRAIELLEVFNLEDLANEKAKNLAYGQQRRLEIVRALATEPKLLFLDEPAAGMNPRETAELTELIHRIKDELGITVVLIEHDMSLVMNICERIYVLEYGKVIAEGNPEEIQSDDRVIKAYLGGVD
ncbi:ABC transporter ATP-binding protein [Aerococcus sanguinicola]|uniref:ABC transporter ATP-binding protein n=1 Tax=unclassified Aerococcus TaxID=2618060 RepID=UPI0008A2A604|nr:MULTISPECIES: ABC transporter ATP-binding protein [unclassified Aerococcus]MDK6233326.1 ABC transporter ATP-binding protein [Aerococcus sp. UMB10185]MDK6804954.1 ABC transporter ATP-binding protein [Aerococcus sp. UMB7834]MDK6855155.1 ABC transporter ATP-binding protein [Aerococcus sp. UMB7533]MDK8501931.1 ABC transporter ATP-binding protein [Aerococcus sp. UMB1112A]OFN04337.1 ABC transporter ATP-binding protein [Aerococcus sp. HMSC062A02]